MKHQTTNPKSAITSARDGDRVRIVMLDVPDRRPVEDVVCTDARSRRLFESAGLGVFDVQSPLATGKEATAMGGFGALARDLRDRRDLRLRADSDRA
jgi:hypothetical protein